MFFIILGSTSWFCVYLCRMMHMLHLTLCALLMNPTQIMSPWFEDRKKKTLMLWSIKFESNFLLSHASLFHCGACNIFLLFGPSTRLMSLGCKMSSLWVTVMVPVPCMSLRTTTLMRCFMFPITFGLPGIDYGTRPMNSSILCSKMTPTLLTLLARFFCIRRKPSVSGLVEAH